MQSLIWSLLEPSELAILSPWPENLTVDELPTQSNAGNKWQSRDVNSCLNLTLNPVLVQHFLIYKEDITSLRPQWWNVDFFFFIGTMEYL